MEAKYWRDTNQDMDRKRRRQAEFLVHQQLPWELISEVAVMKKTVEHKVRAMLEQEGDATPVRTQRAWYY